MPLPGELTDCVHFIKDTQFSELENLLDWTYPVLLARGNSALNTKTLDEFSLNAYQLGLSAIWNIPQLGDPVIFPNISFPKNFGEIVLTTDDPMLRQHYRQISAFAGFDTRCDFTTADDIIMFLNQFSHQSKSDSIKSFPHLVIVDLDSNRIDPLLLFKSLAILNQNQPQIKRQLKLMITKDFSKPGLDIRSIDQILRPFARRIFHPLESLTVLLEALHLNKNQKAPEMTESRNFVFRSMDELLYGKQSSLNSEIPEFRLQKDSIASARNIEPFLWLYKHLMKLNSRGLVLAPMAQGSIPNE